MKKCSTTVAPQREPGGFPEVKFGGKYEGTKFTLVNNATIYIQSADILKVHFIPERPFPRGLHGEFSHTFLSVDFVRISRRVIFIPVGYGPK